MYGYLSMKLFGKAPLRFPGSRVTSRNFCCHSSVQQKSMSLPAFSLFLAAFGMMNELAEEIERLFDQGSVAVPIQASISGVIFGSPKNHGPSIIIATLPALNSSRVWVFWMPT